MIVSAAWIVPAVFAVINRIAQARLQGWEPATLRELLFEFGDWLLYTFLTPGVFAVSRKWPLARPYLARLLVDAPDDEGATLLLSHKTCRLDLSFPDRRNAAEFSMKAVDVE